MRKNGKKIKRQNQYTAFSPLFVAIPWISAGYPVDGIWVLGAALTLTRCLANSEAGPPPHNSRQNQICGPHLVKE